MSTDRLFAAEFTLIQQLFREGFKSEKGWELILEWLFDAYDAVEQIKQDVKNQVAAPEKLAKLLAASKGVSWTQHYETPQPLLELKMLSLIVAAHPYKTWSDDERLKGRARTSLDIALLKRLLPLATAIDFNNQAQALYGLNMHQLMKAANSGDDEALGKAIIIDPSVLYAPLTRDKFMAALLTGDKDMMVSLCNKVVNDHTRPHEQKHARIKLAMRFMNRVKCLDVLTPKFARYLFLEKFDIYEHPDPLNGSFDRFIREEKKKYGLKLIKETPQEN